MSDFIKYDTLREGSEAEAFAKVSMAKRAELEQDVDDWLDSPKAPGAVVNKIAAAAGLDWSDDRVVFAVSTALLNWRDGRSWEAKRCIANMVFLGESVRISNADARSA